MAPESIAFCQFSSADDLLPLSKRERAQARQQFRLIRIVAQQAPILRFRSAPLLIRNEQIGQQHSRVEIRTRTAFLLEDGGRTRPRERSDAANFRSRIQLRQVLFTT